MNVYKTKGVCSRSIEFELDGDTIKYVKFNGGCNGNTKGIASLVEGMKVDDVINRLKGTDCGGRGTSCPDQLAKALEVFKQKEKSRTRAYLKMFIQFRQLQQTLFETKCSKATLA